MNIEQSIKEYVHEGHAVYSCQYHVVFCPKYRRKILDGAIATRLKELFVEAQKVYGYNLIDCEIMPDHVHMLVGIKPTERVTDMIGRIKGYTSHILRKEFPEIDRRVPTLWTRGKFVSTCGTVSLDVVKKYIEEQKGK